MIKTALLLILNCIYVHASSQIATDVSGRVADSATGKPVPFAAIAVTATNGIAIKKIISDSLGNYTVNNVLPGSYRVSVTAVGYIPFASSLFLLKDSMHASLGIHFLKRDTGLLSEMLVQANKPIMTESAEGFSYNAENDLIVSGATAADLMRKIPMVSVSQNGYPTLRGSTNVRIYIDDKPSDLYAVSPEDALKQIPAEDIVRVEVILYPSSKYDAEGTDDVINLITRKTRFNAVKGTLRTQVGNRSQNFTPDLTIRRGKWIFNTSGGVAASTNITEARLTRQTVSAASTNNLLQQRSSRNNARIFYLGGSIIYVINDLHVISAGYRFRYNRNYSHSYTLSDYMSNNLSSESITRDIDGTAGNDLNTLNFSYNGKSRDRKWKYNFLATYFSLQGIDDYDLGQLQKQVLNYRENFRGEVPNKELLLQADFTKTISDDISWDGGLKSAFRDYGTINRFEVFDFAAGNFVKDLNRSNDFNYRRSINAVYTNLSARVKKWQLRIGVRYEKTGLDLGYKNASLSVPGYGNFVPLLLLSKPIKENHTLKWSYNKSIARPMGDMNPAINYTDSFNIQTGNPYLLPEITDRYEMSYSVTKNQLFFIAATFYNKTKNAVEQVRLPLAGGTFVTTPRNLGRNEILGFYGSFSWKFTQKLTLSSTINLRLGWLKSAALQQSVSGLQGGGNATLGYVLHKGLSVEMIGSLSSPDITLQGKRDIWKYYAAIINKKFKGDKLSMILRMDNILSPTRQEMKQTFSAASFNQQLSNFYLNRYFWLTIAWKFGKKEVKAPAIRSEPDNQ